MCEELEISGMFPFPGKCGQTYLKPLGARRRGGGGGMGVARGDAPKGPLGTLRGCRDDESEFQGRRWFSTSHPAPRGTFREI